MPPFDLNSFFSAFQTAGQQVPGMLPAPMQQQLRQPQPQPQQQRPDMVALIQALGSIMNPDALGPVARANSRPGGRTPADQWAEMFAPISAARQAQMTNHPQAPLSEIANAEGYADRAYEGANASPASWTPSYQAPRLGPVMPGTWQADQVAGKIKPPQPNLLSLFGL